MIGQYTLDSSVNSNRDTGTGFQSHSLHTGLLRFHVYCGLCHAVARQVDGRHVDVERHCCTVHWKPHIQSVKSKLSCILSIMYKASKLITTAGMYTLYCSLFQLHISYGNELWGNTYASNVNCLCIIQRKVVGLICNADRLAHTKFVQLI